jgi:cell division protein FtsI (penicillin-binding protein 3)
MIGKIKSSLAEASGAYDNEAPRPKTKFWKFWLIMIAFAFTFVTIVYKLFTIQVVKGEEYASLAKRQSESTITLKAARGDILDRNGNLLATTLYSVSVAVDPMMLENEEAVCQSLSDATDRSFDYYQNKIRSARRKDRRFVWLSRGIDADKSKIIKALDDPGIIINTVPKRKLPLGSAISQVVGLVNIDGIGISGLEMALDSVLRGKDGRMILLRDALGNLKPRADLPRIPQTDGVDVQLTIDSRLQRIVELELKNGVEASQAASATAIAIHPATGEILAMASYPSFDPESGRGAAYSRIRAITDSYEPGSTFKLITAAASLQEGITDEDEMFFAHHGTARFNGYTIRDVHRMDSASFKDAIRYSSNIIMAELANRLSDADFYSYVRDFGFGLPTEIELPGENSGKVKQPGDFTKATKRYMGHGYELSVTPLQVCNAYAAVANGGKLMSPYLVKRVISPEGETIAENKPNKLRQVISEETADRLTPLFSAVVDSGSGKRAKVEGLMIAGKTGTSQQIENGRYSKQFYTASFAGYYPADNPEIAMLVYVDKPRTSIYGGSIAAPIFKGIASRYGYLYPKSSRFITEVSDSITTPSVYGINSSDIGIIENLYSISLESPKKTDDEDNTMIVFDQRPKEFAIMRKASPVRYTVIPEKSFSPKASTDDADTSHSKLIKHDLLGLPLRRAIGILNSMGIKPVVDGSGIVKKQVWKENSNGNMECHLKCS